MPELVFREGSDIPAGSKAHIAIRQGDLPTPHPDTLWVSLGDTAAKSTPCCAACSAGAHLPLGQKPPWFWRPSTIYVACPCCSTAFPCHIHRQRMTQTKHLDTSQNTNNSSPTLPTVSLSAASNFWTRKDVSLSILCMVD